MDDLLTLFLAGEGSEDSVRRTLLDEIANRSSGERYFTFDVWNVRVDVDAQTVTVEDELDASREVTVPLEEFRALLAEEE